jgi:hypothetical protein
VTLVWGNDIGSFIPRQGKSPLEQKRDDESLALARGRLPCVGMPTDAAARDVLSVNLPRVLFVRRHL